MLVFVCWKDYIQQNSTLYLFLHHMHSKYTLAEG